MGSMQRQEPLDGHPAYEKIAHLAKGISGRSFVQLARSRVTGDVVAIKFIPRVWEPSHSKYVLREILNHQELSLSKHPHIVEFKEVFVTQRFLGQVMEYVQGETLQGFLEKVGGKVIEGLARFIFQQLIIAVDFCHRKGKINRDIKLSNILLSIAEGQLPLLKLCGFEFSKDTVRNSEPHSQVGTALFTAPEVMQNFQGGRYDGRAADMWACGVVLAIMLFGRHPFLRPSDSSLTDQQQMIKLFQRVMNNDIEFPPEVAATLSADCIDLLSKLLKVDPSQRYNMQLVQAHPWFRTALPDGAALMNDLFLAEEQNCLPPQSQGQIEELVYRASLTEEQYAAIQAQRRLAVPALQLQQQQQQQQQQQALARNLGCMPQHGLHTQQPPQYNTSPLLGHMFPNNNYGPSPQRPCMPLAHAPAGNGGHDMHGVPDLEAMVMSMPSAELLQAATIDLHDRRNRADSLLAGPSFASSSFGLPKTLTELQQQMQSLERAQSANNGSNSPSGSHEVDAAPFLYEGEDDVPLTSIASFNASIDWGSFNASFSMFDRPPMTGNNLRVNSSLWHRICSNVSAKFSDSARPGVPGPGAFGLVSGI